MASPITPSAAQQAQRDAARQIEQARKQVKQAAQESEKEIERVKADTDVQISAESLKSQARIENERHEGYERVREQRRLLEAEQARVRREGERELARVDHHYKSTLQNQTHGKTAAMTEHEKKAALEIELARRAHEDTTQTLTNEHRAREAHLKQEQEARTQALVEGYSKDYETKKLTTQTEKSRAEARMKEQYSNLEAQHDAILNRLYDDANRNLTQVKTSTAQQLDAYSDRKDDPFYQMVKTDARLEDSNDAYVLRVTVPAHEREGVSVSVQGNQLVLAGTRRNSDSFQTETGEKTSTSTYQTYQQSFPLNDAVVPRLLSRSFEDDTLTVVLPKHSGAQAYRTHAERSKKRSADDVPKLISERPRFPKEIAAVVDGKEPEQIVANPDARRGNRTLT